MQKIEKDADAGGLTYDQMMENAGQGLADIVLDLFLDEIEPKVVGLVGPGNNGSDTLIALTALAESGWGASACLVKRKKDDLVERFTEAGGERCALAAVGGRVDSPPKRKEPKARKMLKNAARTHRQLHPRRWRAIILYGRTRLRSENALLARKCATAP
jgi:NAD(P)H-hydrate repair Nnr-like enzyme with NAD(P)H-hydrate epimerase domain